MNFIILYPGGKKMRKKILGIFICMLLIVTVFPATGKYDVKTIFPTNRIESIPVLDLILIKGGFFSISILLVNFGEGTAENIYWEMNVSGGLFFYPKSRNGDIDVLSPGEDQIIKIRPALGFGVTTINFYLKYKIANLSCGVDIELIQEWKDQAFLFMHLFPETIQPVKDWLVIEDYSYFNETDTTGVELYHTGINNMHNVRVALGSDSFYQEIEFLGACKFTDGIGILEECGITEELVTGGDAHWEIELVDGE